MSQTVYIASPESGQIHVFDLNGEGALTLRQVVDTGAQVQPMVVSPDQRFLYVGVRPEFQVLAYRITPEDGTLILAGEAPLPGSPTHISTDHQGRFLFCASYNADSVSVIPLMDGLPQSVAYTVEGLEGCHSANISPDNHTLWVPTLKQDRICLFTLAEDGTLSAQRPADVQTVEGAGPRHMVFHPDRHFAYCINELNSNVDVWELNNPHGEIECVQSLDMMPANFCGTRWAADIHITPDGRYLYTCDRTASVIAIFSVSDDGSVLTLEGHHVTEEQPRGFNIDNSGRYLIAAGQKSHHIAVYAIQPGQGLLTELKRYAVGQGPMWVTITTR